MYPFPFGDTVTRVRAGTKPNPAGNDTTADWATATEDDFLGVNVTQGASFETAEPGRVPLTADFTLLGPPAWDLLSTDRVRVRGALCDVIGDPFDDVHPMTGWNPGTVVTVRKRER